MSSDDAPRLVACEVAIAAGGRTWLLRDSWSASEAEEAHAWDGALALSVGEVGKLGCLQVETANKVAEVLGKVKNAIPGSRLVSTKGYSK